MGGECVKIQGRCASTVVWVLFGLQYEGSGKEVEGGGEVRRTPSGGKVGCPRVESPGQKTLWKGLKGHLSQSTMGPEKETRGCRIVHTVSGRG